MFENVPTFTDQETKLRCRAVKQLRPHFLIRGRVSVKLNFNLIIGPEFFVPQHKIPAPSSTVGHTSSSTDFLNAQKEYGQL